MTDQLWTQSQIFSANQKAVFDTAQIYKMAEKTANVQVNTANNAEDSVLNSLKARNEPLTSAEILEMSSFPSQQIEKALQRLESQQIM